MYRYFWFDDVTEEYFGVSFANPSKDLTHTTILEKNHCMRWFGKKGKMAHLFTNARVDYKDELAFTLILIK